MNLSDEDIVKWMDGKADQDLKLKIAAADQADLQQRMDDFDVDTKAVKQSFDTLLDHAPAPPAFLAAEKRRPKRSIRVALAAAACLVIGVFIGGLGEKNALASWHEYAAAYHALYVEETLGTLVREDPVLTKELSRVASALGTEIALADVQVDGLSYRRSQVLGFEGAPLAQLAFVAADGAPIALCILKAGANTPSKPIELASIVEMPSAIWANGDLEFMLVGHMSDSDLQRFAEAFLRQL